MKKLLSLLLAICMMASIVALLPVFASETETTVDHTGWTAIDSVAEFIAMSADGKYYLTDDIDFDSVEYSGVIWGGSAFAGTLDGNGKSLLNIKINGTETGVASIFGADFHGTIMNLTFGSAAAPVYVRSSMDDPANEDQIYTVVAATITGDEATFENVNVYADIKFEGKTAAAFGRVAAFAGNVAGTKVTFTNCHVYGKLDGRPVAGFVVSLMNSAPDITFTNCSNNAEVLCSYKREDGVAGFYASTWIGSKSENPHKLTFINCQNNGKISSYKGSLAYNASAGGFICTTSQIVFDVTMEGCTNNGTVYADHGCTAGFIAIRNNGSASAESSYVFKNCVNNGAISGRTNTGNAAAGIMAATIDTWGPITIENCVNNGAITGGTRGAGGIFTVNSYRTTGAYRNKTISIIGCINTAKVTAAGKFAGGIVGQAGGIDAKSSNASNNAATIKLTIQYCMNLGDVVNSADTGSAAGICGEINSDSDAPEITVITNNYSIGTVKHTANGGSVYAICRADFAAASGIDSMTISNNVWLDGTVICKDANGNAVAGTDLNENVTGNNFKVTSAAELLAKLNEVKIADSPVQFVADLGGTNNGYPVLSWQLPENATAPKFSEGSIEDGVISTTGVTGYVSYRQNKIPGKSDLRFVLAVDLEASKTYETLDVTIEFCDAQGVVKTFTLGFDELSFYETATAANKTYTAADGDALFGAVVNGVPNNAWRYVIVTVTTADGSKMSGIATTEILNDEPVEDAPIAPTLTADAEDISDKVDNKGMIENPGALEGNNALVIHIKGTDVYTDWIGTLDSGYLVNPDYITLVEMNGKLFKIGRISVYDQTSQGYLRLELGGDEFFEQFEKVDGAYTLNYTVYAVDAATNTVKYYFSHALKHQVEMISAEKPAGLTAVEGVTCVSGPNKDGGEGAAKAFDNNIKTKLCTGNNGAENAIVASLGGEKTLKGISLVNANDNTPSTSRTVTNFEVWVSEDGENWGEEAAWLTTGEGVDKKDISANFAENFYAFDAPITATYVKLVINNGGYYQFSEVIFYQ